MTIEIRHLDKYYGTGRARSHVLESVDLEIADGEFLAIVGTSGSGKTTLLNIVGGLDRDYEGRAAVDGRDLAELDERELADLRNQTFGFVFQQFNVLDHLTARENVGLPGFFRRGGDRTGAADPDELLERVGLGDKRDAHPNRLSGGQRQRVAIARALYANPAHILCDEPTGNLDRRTGLQIMEVFRTLNREDGMTLVMVTHEEHIARMAERIVRLEDGRIISDDPNEPVKPEESSIVDTEGAAPHAQ